ncbi:hypothetical protein CHARACLAT_017148 [Characodon lateralis]|uniref:Uncharacterized protein n=1 Tax=Characodon lateralis TaxID=208331 RepID=A0ABU7D1U2_9TELE|nr:hypothetical protein [Characodon lateralis]
MFYMLKSLVAQKEAIVAYAYEYSLLPTLAHQWTLVENILTILDACEQLTRNISKVTATTDLSPSIQALMRLRKQSVPTDQGVKKIKRNPVESNAFGKTFCSYRRRAPVLYGNNTGPKVQG